MTHLNNTPHPSKDTLSPQERREIAQQIERRILSLVIAVPYGIEKLLSLLDIVITENIPTAAVPINETPKLYINPNFVQKHCDTEEKLFVLILHELHHVLLGHTRLYKRVTPHHNLAFDAIINAMLSRMNPSPSWTALFRDYYKPDVFPFYFLRPPEGYPKEPKYPENMPINHQRIIYQLYYKNGGSFHEIFYILSRELKILPSIFRSNKNGIPCGSSHKEQGTKEQGESNSLSKEDIFDALLGNHDEDERGYEHTDNPTVFEAIRAIVERWPQPDDPLVGRSLADLKRVMNISVIQRKTPDKTIKKALFTAAQKGFITCKKHKFSRPQILQQAWPTKDRRAFPILATGKYNLLYNKTIQIDEQGIKPIHIYIDVSGSMTGFLSDIISGVISCRKWIVPQIFTFSNGIEETNIQELQNGNYRTTGGTDIVEVSQHIKENRFKNVVLLTDGYVGPPDKNTIEYIKKINLHIVLTMGGLKSDLEILNPTFHMFEYTSINNPNNH